MFFRIFLLLWLAVISPTLISAADPLDFSQGSFSNQANPSNPVELAVDNSLLTVWSPSDQSNIASPSSVASDTMKRAELIQSYLSAGMTYNEALSAADTVMASGGPTIVIVSEKVPGATCKCYIGGAPTDDATCENAKVEERLYQCTIQKGMTSFQIMIREIVRWFVYIIMLLWVLALVWAGILWAWGSESEEYTKKAKWWAVNIIIWLVILFSFRYILGFLAPWIFR